MSRARGSSRVFTCWGAASWCGGCSMLALGAGAAASAGSRVCARRSVRFGVLWRVVARWWVSWLVALSPGVAWVVAGGGR